MTTSDPLIQQAQALAKQKKQEIIVPIGGRIAYVVSHGQSYASNGYAIRTQGIAQALNQHGLESLCFVQPGRPWELGVEKGTIKPEMVIDGVRYIHSRWEADLRPQNELEHLNRSVEQFVTLFRVYRPAYVLAASNYIVGLPAWVAAQQLGIPFVNEVRGFWELSRDAREPGYGKTEDYRLEAARDIFVAQQAEQIFTLNQPMQQELVKRGISPEKIHLVPNGVSRLPDIKPADPELKKQLGIQADDKVIGYVGSHTAYEGLDILVEACDALVKQGGKIKLLLVGDAQPLTAQQADKHPQSSPWLIQTGRVDHGDVARYYALIDTIVIPRKKHTVCEIVPPMKAAEALVYGKRLVVSDVAPLAEYSDKYEVVVSFEAGSSASLATALQESLKLLSPKPNADLLFFAHTESMVRALKGEGSTEYQVTATATATALKSVENHVPTPEAQSAILLGTLYRPETVALPKQETLWYNVPVASGQELIIEAASEYYHVKGAQNRKAVLLINALDADGKPVDKACGNMSKSEQFKAHFKYLPCTKNQVQELHSFIVPEGVSEIRLGVTSFNTKNKEKVMLRKLRVKPRPDNNKPTQFVPPSAQAAEISILGWPDYPPNGKPYVMGIMDEFTTGCFEQDVNLIQPRPDNWYALAEKYKPKFFFIESAWKGNNGSWQYRVADYANKPGQEVAHMCQYAREKGIPTIFWNKEDPVHHEKFMCSANLTDHIFTTDANMKSSYTAKTGNRNVHAMPFAAQPALHKPAPLAGRINRSCFAGSWYGNRHAERGVAMQWLLSAANPYGLDIYDRNHGTGIFPFPEEYQAGIKGSLPYKELCREYSRYRIFLNVNSVTESPTMFSRRVFELMACGTPIVSTYAKGIENLFESDAVWLVNSQKEADEALHILMTDDKEWRRRSLAGIREVFSKHTYAHRLNDIFMRLGIETELPTAPEMVLLAQPTTKDQLGVINQFASKQHYQNFRVLVKCSLALRNMVGSLHERITIVDPGMLAQRVVELKSATVAGWLDANHRYGERYLEDLANATLYEPEADGWAKALQGDAFAYQKQSQLAGSVWRKEIFVNRWLQSGSDQPIKEAALFVADSAEFSVGSNTANHMVVGV